MDIDLKQLRELLRALKQFDLEELEIEKNGERIKLRRGASGPAYIAPAITMAPPPPDAPSAAPAPKAAEAPKDDASIAYVTSPFVGTFYRAPSPQAANFVEVGSSIRVGQPLCIVEAMKLMNEIESEISGTIVDVLVDNGKPVQFGDKLFRVRKS